MRVRCSAACVALELLMADTAAAQTAPPPSLTFTGAATLITDYRFRGLSRSNGNVAVQASAIIEHKSGLYLNFWGSSIGEYVANGSNAELDLIAGYKKTVGGTTIDSGIVYYVYPGHGSAKTDSFEPYVSLSRTFGPVLAKAGGNVSWKQSGLGLNNDPRAGVYGYGELALAIPRTPVTTTVHLGHSFVKNDITFRKAYTDWSVAAAYTYRQLTFTGTYVDTDTRVFSYPLGGGRNRNIAGTGIVGSIGLAF